MTEQWSSTNQQKTEPIPPSPAHGEDTPLPGDGLPTAGDARGVPVPSENAAEGTSETMAPVEGVRATSIAPEGLADGETDNRMPPTSTF